MKTLALSLLLFSSLFCQSQPLALHFAAPELLPGDTACIELTAKDFQNMVSFQFTIHWDTAALAYLSSENGELLNSPALGDLEVENGILPVSWFDLEGSGVSLPDESILLECCFLVKSCSKDTVRLFVNGEPLQVEVYRLVAGEPMAMGIAAETAVFAVANFQEINLGRDTFLCQGEQMKLEAAACEGCSVIWEDGSTEVQRTLETGGDFAVTVTNSSGCTAADTLHVTLVESPTDLLQPINFLTPNGDGQNDRLVFDYLGKFKSNQLTVFNRWGDVVFEAVNYGNDWDGTHRGKPLPAGVYYYVLSVNSSRSALKSVLTITR